MIGGRGVRGAAIETELAAFAIAFDNEPFCLLEGRAEPTVLARYATVVARTQSGVARAVRAILAPRTAGP